MIPHAYLEHSLSVLHTRLTVSGRSQPFGLRSELHPFITISRETGAGASSLGQHLVPMLNQELEVGNGGWVFLDKDLLKQALLHHQLPAQLAEYLPEDRISETKAVIGELLGLHPSLWQLEQKIAEAILQLAHVGHVIFAGRAAHLITRGVPAGLHVRLVASLPTRIARMATVLNCSEGQARAHIERSELARRNFVRAHFDQDINDPHHYDLVINSDNLTPGAAARIVVTALLERLKSLSEQLASPAFATT
jgi:cytidylate kinase